MSSSTHPSAFNLNDESFDQKQDTQRLIFRIVPYIPLIIFFLLLGVAGGYLVIRYATRIYAVKARLIVNDDSQQKSSNLLEIVQLDTRNLSAETEKEMQILSSGDLLSQLVSKLQLNVKYSQKGYFKSGQAFEKVPFKLELIQPDSIDNKISGEVRIINNTIHFNGVVYPVDTMVKASWGLARWHINNDYKKDAVNEKWFVTVQTVGESVGEVKNSLLIRPITKQSAILELIYTDEVPERGVEILKNLITLYGAAGVDYKSRISANTLRFLDDRLRIVSDELNGVEKNLQNYRTSQGVIDLGAEGDLLLRQSKDADIKIAELEVQADVLNQIEQYVTQRNNTSSTIPATLGLQDAVLTGLLTQLYQAEFDLEKTKQISGIKNPQVEVYEEQIAKLKPSILKSINNLKIGIQQGRQRLQSDNQQMNSRLAQIPQKQRVLLDITRQQSIKNAIYTYLLQKREESAVAAAALVPNYRVIEKPESSGLVEPVKEKIYGIGILAALILASLYIYLREFSSRRLLFRSQIESRLDVPIVGELIYQPSVTGSPIVVGDNNRTVIAEQFREIRTNLGYISANIDERCKVFLITSSIPGEGKSFVAINTAVSLSLIGSNVVLIEFDLRKPKISKQLAITRDPGLSNYLIGKSSVEEIIKKHSSISNFNIIPSGPIPPNPAELLSSPRLTTLINSLKERFDYIIIDSPPVGSVTDAKILASIVHGTLFIVRHNFTNITFLQLIHDLYQKNIFPNMGMVFNAITPKKILGYTYGGQYGYGYGYGYGYTENNEKKSWWKKIFKRKLS